MHARSSLCRLLALATLLAASFSLGWPAAYSHAQEWQRGARVKQGATHNRAAPRDAVIGGYSMSLSEVWGLPEMPPAPKDFGPHFDFPPQPLNGVPLHDPYPN
jgi:hypothetical protein